MEFVKRGLKDF